LESVFLIEEMVMFRKPVIWIIIAVLAVMSTIVAVRYFPRAFPIVSLDLQMDRELAMEQARQLAVRYGWGPEDFRQAASFSGNENVQYYVELEAGGVTALRDMMQKDAYHPYTWRVRHFQAGDAHETRIVFKPDGTPYGFRIKLPEEEPGPTLTADAARAIAESLAVADWKIDFSLYEPVETALDVRIGGRTDHTFVYERSDMKIGEGLYRLRLMVAGDRFAELNHFVKVPEGFDRRYQEMRSRNEMLSMFSVGAFALLYGVVGILIGLFVLLKQRYVLWRKALLWGLFIALLRMLVLINSWPLEWMDYDTALSPGNFLLQRILMLLGTFIGEALLLALTFMAAESLSRKAFPHHAQLWKVWSKEPAASPHVWGLTFGGYLWVPLTFLFSTLFYYFTNRLWGWWTPSDMLFQPDMLAHHFPWLSSLAISLQAGFWEESFFRAIPIAGAVLLGRRYGKTGIWLVGAMILQALIFGSAHANYPQQPAYARIAELFVPFVFYGIIYYFFGLLPVIISHFIYDVIWFALPLFVSSASSIWIDRALVILLALVPVWVILVARLRAGKWLPIADHLNRTWTPPPQKIDDKPITGANEMPISAWTRRMLTVAGLVGLLVWALFTPFVNHTIPLQLDKSRAIDYAQQELAARGIELPDHYKTLPFVLQPMDVDDRFVWQTGGSEVTDSLMGSYLAPPLWKVRYATFSGDIEERAEEYIVSVGNDGKIYRFIHQLPESRAGARLDEAQARQLAHQHLQERFGKNAAELLETTAEPKKLPNRTDWSFVYADTAGYPMAEGQARMTVHISGDEVTDAYALVHVPEEWQRLERNRNNAIEILQTTSQSLLILSLIAGVVLAIIFWSRKQFDTRLFLIVAGALVLLRIALSINSWPSVCANFVTAQSFETQKAIVLVGIVIGTVFIAAAFGLVIGFLRAWLPQQKRQPQGWLLAVLAGMAVSGLVALLLRLSPSLTPKWPDYTALDRLVPLFGVTFSPLISYLLNSAFLLLLFRLVSTISDFGRRRKGLLAFLMLLAGFIFAGQFSFDSVLSFVMAGVVLGAALLLLYLGLFNRQLYLVWIFVAVLIMIEQLANALVYSQPFYWLGMGLSMAMIALVAWSMTRAFMRTLTDK